MNFLLIYNYTNVFIIELEIYIHLPINKFKTILLTICLWTKGTQQKTPLWHQKWTTIPYIHPTSKVQGSRKGHKWIKGVATKLAQGQPNTIEDKFARLEALVTSMATQVKFITFGPRKAKDQENGQ
jgi:hypothetical protein